LALWQLWIQKLFGVRSILFAGFTAAAQPNAGFASCYRVWVMFKNLAGFGAASPPSGSKLPRHRRWFPTRFSELKINRARSSPAPNGKSETKKPRIIGALFFAIAQFQKSLPHSIPRHCLACGECGLGSVCFGPASAHAISPNSGTNTITTIHTSLLLDLPSAFRTLLIAHNSITTRIAASTIQMVSVCIGHPPDSHSVRWVVVGRVHLILEGGGGGVSRVARDGGLSGKSILTVRA